MSQSASLNENGFPSVNALTISASEAVDERVVAAGDDNVTTILHQLNRERRLFNLPIIVFLVFLAGFGVSGNVCVLHVYRTRFRKTAGSFFITALAVLDLVSSVFCVPFDIFDLCFPYIYAAPVACRIFRFVEYYTAMAAGLILACVAFSRYFKIVNPFRCYSAGQARALVIVMAAVALSIVWPQLVLSGSRTVPTRVPGILGEDCNISDSAANTVYPLIFYSVLLAVFFLCFSIMLVFYARIVGVVWKRSRTQIGELVRVNRPRRGDRRKSSGASAPTPPTSPVALGFDSSLSNSSSQISISTISLPASPPPRAAVKARSRRTKKVRLKPASHLGRTTRMLSLVTFVALLGYFPFLTVQVVALAGVGFQIDALTSYSEQLAFQFCLKSHYLSSAANPLIYSILSPTFRKESMIALKKFLTTPIINLFHNCQG